MLSREILRQLGLAAPYTVPVASLRTSVVAAIGRCGEDELRSALVALKAKGKVRSEVDDVTDDERWGLVREEPR